MEAIVLDTNLDMVGIIDLYESFIWTDRYNKNGDFELKISAKDGLPEYIQKDYYLINPDSEHVMIIDSILLETDFEKGSFFTIKGKSLEYILNRRIVWKKTSFEAASVTDPKPNLQDGIKRLLTENVISPEIAARRIDNFEFEESTLNKITSLEFEAQYFGEDLYEIISKLCEENDIGFKITLTDDKKFVFKLYAGEDRSYGTDENPQIFNPYVIFSPKFDNVINTSYLDSNSSFKNVTLVGGEAETNDQGEEISRDTYVVTLADFSVGLNRREIFTNASSVTRNIDSEDALTEEQYQAHLRQAGIDTLIDNTITTIFESELEPKIMYIYGQDYFIGDIIQIENEYGQGGRAYISEFVTSCDTNGMSAYPTFETIQKGVYETE
jgi:hypothetical protein